MKFAVNVSILFKEAPFLERFALARNAGFTAVEFWWPRGEDLGEVRAAVADAGLDVVLMNFDAGDMPAGDRGLLSDPERAPQFRDNVPVALELAEQLGCRRFNALVGLERSPERDTQLALARENVAWARRGRDRRRGADRGRQHMGERSVSASHHAAGGRVHPRGRPAEREAAVRRVPHAAHGGQSPATLREHIDGIAHVQVADSPGRGEPGTGEINYPYVLGVLEELGYDGYVGLEYNPTTARTEDSFSWLPAGTR